MGERTARGLGWGRWLLASSLVMAGCHDGSSAHGAAQSGDTPAGTTQGNGVQKSETRDVSGFDSILVDGAITLELVHGDFEKPVLSGDENLLPLVTTTVSDHRLTVHQTKNISTKNALTLTIHAPDIKQVDSNGASKVHAKGLLGPLFTLVANGAADAELAGKVDELDVKLNGAGRVKAVDLLAKQAVVAVAGAGDVDVNASDKLEVKVGGAGAVRYKGAPTIDKEITGVGTVAHID